MAITRSNTLIQATVDASSLNKALSIANKFSKTMPQQAVDSAAYHVAKRAYELTPIGNVQAIDTALGTAWTRRVGKRGQPLSARMSKNVIKSGGRMGTTITNVPLAALIISAQVNPGSRYNSPALTNRRFLRARSPWAGKDRRAGAAAMAGAINRLINARHSSGGFLRLGWKAVMNMLAGKFYGAEALLTGGKLAKFGRTYTSQTYSSVSRTIENTVGSAPGARGDNSVNYNRALIRVGSGPLQRAIAEVAWDKIEHVAKKLGDDFKRLFESIPTR